MSGRNINRVLLTGNLTQDPELRSTPSGASVCELRIASNSREKRGGEWVDRADYFDVVVWGAQGENAAQYLSKGRPVAIDGRMRQERWQAKEGGNRSKIVVIADRVQFLGDGKGGGGGERRPVSDFDPGDSGGSSDFDAPVGAGDFAGPATSAADDDIPF